MAEYKRIKCSECEYARQDKNASEYSKKTCGKCERWADCEVCRGCKKRNTCKARNNQNGKQSCDRRCEIICGQQELRWAAYQCTNADSEFYRSLLNVTPNGDMQTSITWCGCREGELK